MKAADDQQVASMAADALEQMVDPQGFATCLRIGTGNQPGNQHRKRHRCCSPANEGHKAQCRQDEDEDQCL
ncbi:hypothetical protein SDC9_209604 [bioreactor metagenome]|uniref:Uncharacterized protein n=1 Tax=bioreactor metagenome TaxID=1076179 RepID=A0A645JGQ4_9ZZZZ